jgi:hypothetical protein
MKPKGSEVLTSTRTRKIAEGLTAAEMAAQDTTKWDEQRQKQILWDEELQTRSKVQRARMNARGYEQVDGVHYDESDKVAPMANENVMRMAIVLLVMAKWMVLELLQWRTWVWDYLVCDKKGGVLTAKEEFIKGCDCESEMVATVDCTKDARVSVRDSLSMDSQREGVADSSHEGLVIESHQETTNREAMYVPQMDREAMNMPPMDKPPVRLGKDE